MKRNVKLKSRKNPKLPIEERDFRELICLCTACRNAWLASLNLSCFIYFLPHISAIRNSIPEIPLKLVKVLAEVTTFSSKAEGKWNKLFSTYLLLISAFAHEVRLGFFRCKFSYHLMLRPGIKLRTLYQLSYTAADICFGKMSVWQLFSLTNSAFFRFDWQFQDTLHWPHIVYFFVPDETNVF